METIISISINSNWKGNGSGTIVNVDSVTDDAVTYHVVSEADRTAPEPHQ